MNPFAAIEKLINEHGSAAILGQQLALAKDQFSALERQVNDFQSKVAKLEAHLEIEQTNHNQTKQELQLIQKEHAEEIRIHSFIEFRRGKRTAGKWAAFCPKCHTPVRNTEGYKDVFCSDSKCGWFVSLGDNPLSVVTKELGE